MGGLSHKGVDVSFCTRCGYPTQGTPFCTNCGERLVPEDSDSAPTPGNYLLDDQQTYSESGKSRVPAWLLVVAAAVVVLGGGAGGWYLTGQHGTQTLASGDSSLSKPSPAGGSAQASTAEPSATPPASASGSAPPPTPAATATAGNSTLALGPGMSGQPAAEVIAAFLGRYFAAINQHDYRAYISLFTATAQRGEPAQKFRSGYALTSDSSEELVALSSTQTAATAASITFVSHQAPAASATQTACTTWRIVLYLRPAGTSYLIGRPPASYRPSTQACS